jgi:broad specificity phosphatase PhoE
LCIGAKQIKRAVLYYQKGCPEPVEYFGIKSSKDLLMPWMYTSKYIREDRRDHETTSILTNFNLTNIQTNEKYIFLVRHGESTDNEAGDRFSGITDCDLTEKGIKQAEEVGKKLQLEHIEYIYTSPMKRAIETARKIQLQAGGALVIDRRLREIDYGDWEGLTRQEVFQKWPELYNKWKQDPVTFYPHNAERPQLALERIINFWDDLRTKLILENIKVVVIVSHKSILRLLISYLKNEPLKKYREHLSFNCSITKVILNKQGDNAQVVYENKIDHLSCVDL